MGCQGSVREREGGLGNEIQVADLGGWVDGEAVNVEEEISRSSADVSATQSELIPPVTAVRAAHGKIARHLHTAARPPGHERESMELLIRTLPAHPAGPPHPRTQSLICC
ncbi:unnamed protein product [Pleuronectes platessa]|uniref:Uncharacterized protein n=1 Tax=Pleuronectes platessa TaxID=8262 RepID=A0A9N7U1H0_PLEPL|nr:unnamed protein product [Pleuronectes platessa]